MKFSSQEIKEIFIAWLLSSLAFAILFSGGYMFFSSLNAFFLSFLISSLTVGIGFLFHELMHKFTAQKYGLFAEFRAFYNMLFLALLFSFFGFIVIVPGAVFIRGRMNKEKNGKIALAGPFANILLAFLFLIFLLLFKFEGIFNLLFSYGLYINSLLALFNLLPFSFFDGSKVLKWNKKIYTFFLIIAGFLFFLTFSLLSP